MRIGAFEIYEPMPQLREAWAFSIMIPWINVGDAGKLALSALMRHSGAQEMGKLVKPGEFFDFTRYRPIITIRDGENRDITLPNTPVSYAMQKAQGGSLIFLSCLEPHMNGEEYVNSILKILELCDVKLYCTIGSMLDSQPHTRPLIITGRASNIETRKSLAQLGVRPSDYKGPTSILTQVSTEAQKQGIDTVSLIVHIPSYLNLDEDYTATYQLLCTLCSLLDFSLDLEAIKRKGEQQYKEITRSISELPQLLEVVETLETRYEQEMEKREEGKSNGLSPEIENFLDDLERKRGQSF